jgi:hypothetical protein
VVEGVGVVVDSPSGHFFNHLTCDLRTFYESVSVYPQVKIVCRCWRSPRTPFLWHFCASNRVLVPAPTPPRPSPESAPDRSARGGGALRHPGRSCVAGYVAGNASKMLLGGRLDVIVRPIDQFRMRSENVSRWAAVCLTVMGWVMRW